MIRQMLERNLWEIDYRNYDVWVGVYPNDPQSMLEIEQCSDPRVHYVVNLHNGPTTKADCLNQILRGTVRHEGLTGKRYDLFIHHDAEDVIHPSEFVEAARLSRDYDMIQFPVLALRTPVWNFTHGMYCDEFAESHRRDLFVRSRVGGYPVGRGGDGVQPRGGELVADFLGRRDLRSAKPDGGLLPWAEDVHAGVPAGVPDAQRCERVGSDEVVFS